MSRLPWMLAVLLALGLGAAGSALLLRPAARALPGSPALIEQVREVARLETLEVSLHQKVSFAPEPPAPSDSTWKSVLDWARFNLKDAHGRALLFADGQLGLELGSLDAAHLQVDGDRAWLVLPPVVARVQLRPGETEIIDSNLDSAQTAQLLAEAQTAFQRQLLADPRLKERARTSAERSLRSLLLGLGFREVHFVEVLPGHPAS